MDPASVASRDCAPAHREKVQEVIKLTYLNNDAVFVSIHALHKVSKYKGKEGVTPAQQAGFGCLGER